MLMNPYADHFERLVTFYGVHVEYKPGSGRAWRKTKRMRIPLIKTAVTYALALHELGHLVGPQGTHRITKELEAWEWARANAMEWTKPMASKAHDCLMTYKAWAIRRGDHVRFDAADFTTRLQNLYIK